MKLISRLWSVRNYDKQLVPLLLFCCACNTKANVAGPSRATMIQVVGSVKSASGAAVPSATVHVTPLRTDAGLTPDSIGGCAGVKYPGAEFETNSNGDFVGVIHGAVLEFVACVAVEVAPPSGSNLMPSTVHVAKLVQFRMVGGSSPIDTAHVQVILSEK